MARLRSRPRDPMRPVAKAEVLPARPCCCASLAHAEGIGEDDIPAARVHHSHLRPARSESCSAVQAQQRSHDCLGCVDLRSRHQSTALVGRFMVGLVVGDEARAGGDAPRRQAVAGQQPARSSQEARVALYPGFSLAGRRRCAAASASVWTSAAFARPLVRLRGGRSSSARAESWACLGSEAGMIVGDRGARSSPAARNRARPTRTLTRGDARSRPTRPRARARGRCASGPARSCDPRELRGSSRG